MSPFPWHLCVPMAHGSLNSASGHLWSLYTNKYAPSQPTVEAQCYWFTNLLPPEERSSHLASKSSFSSLTACVVSFALYLLARQKARACLLKTDVFTLGFLKWKYLCNSDPNFQKVNKFSKGCTTPSPENINSWAHEQRDGVTMFKRQTPKSHPPVCHCTGMFNPRCTENSHLSHES